MNGIFYLSTQVQYSKNSKEQNCVDWTERLKKHLNCPKRYVNEETHCTKTKRIHLNHDSDCDRFAYQFLVRSFFGEGGRCRFNLLYNIGCRLEKCYIVSQRVGGWVVENTIFALYNKRTAP